jgi:hypothetical protein
VPVVEPKPATLKRYGLTIEEWRQLPGIAQGSCFICHQLPKSGRLCIDHEHVKGWKAMPPAKRKLFVRGAVCWRCNTTFLGRGINVDRANNVVTYLRMFEGRRPC